MAKRLAITRQEPGDTVTHDVADLTTAFKEGNKCMAEHLLTHTTIPPATTFHSLCFWDKAKVVALVSLLHLAAYWGWTDVVICLVSVHSCSPKWEDSEGHIPLHYAAYNGQLEVVRYFITKLHCNPIARNNDNRTPLHVTCAEGHLNVAQYLICEVHCNPSCVDDYGRTPLHDGCYNGHLSIIQYLISEACCGPSHENNQGDTPLHVACLKGYFQYLISEAHSCSLVLSHENNQGDTPLHISCRNNDLRIVQCLISEAHCNPSCKNDLGDTPLHISCQNGDFKIVQYLISKAHCNPSCKNNLGDTPFHVACQKGYFKIIQYLISKARYHSSYENNQGDTPLHISCRNGDFEIAHCLISEARCNLTNKNNQGDTPLHISCQKGDFKITQCLISEARCNPSHKNNQEDTPLHISCRNGDLKIVQSLISEARCNPSCKNCHGDTPLHVACQKGYFKIAQCLISEAHCDLSHENNQGDTPLHISCQKGDFKIAQCLIGEARCNLSNKNNQGDTPLHISCRKGDLKIAQCLISEARCNPSHKNNQGDTPLHVSCRNGDLEIVQSLISEARCNPSCKNCHGDTPLHVACQKGYFKIAQCFISEARCDLSHENNQGDTPLHISCQNGDLKIAQCLIGEARCNLSHRNNRGDTPLHISCQNGDFKIAQCFINEACCDLSHENKQGDTPLHISCRNGDFKIVQCLISEARCNLPHKDNNGDTLLHVACRNNAFNIVQYLISEAHCNPSLKNYDGDTPLHVACRKGYFKIIQYLISEVHCNPSCKNKHSDTPLHISCRNGDLEIAQYLISEAHCDPSRTGSEQETPLHLACRYQKVDIVRYLLSTGQVNPLAEDKYGHTPLSYAVGNYNIIKLFKEFDCSRDYPVHTFTKLILTGDSGAGKTTIAQLIIQATHSNASHNIFGRLGKMLRSADLVTEVERFTAGIIPHHIKSELGNFVVYDFAGQQEYYSSHAAILEQVMRSSAAIFICMIDLNKSEDEIGESLHYWLSFINNACNTERRSHVAIVGSHADQVRSLELREKNSLLQSIAARRVKCQEYVGCVAMNCRLVDTAASRQLISILTNSQKAIITSQPLISIDCHLLYAFLCTKMKVVGCTLSDLTSAIAKEYFPFRSGSFPVKQSYLPNDPSVLTKLLTILSDKGLILFIQDSQSTSWVVVKTKALLNDINGTLYAPDHFKEHRDLASNTGIVPACKLREVFPQYNPEMLHGFLTSLSFCRLVYPSVLQYTNLQTNSSISTTDLFFFPGLVQTERPDSLTQDGTLQFGWCLGCVDRNQFFGSRFLHLLLLSVAYRFPLAARHSPSPSLQQLERRCTIWKNGISWRDADNITTVVELFDKNRWVLVAMSTSEDRPVEHAKLRSSIISLVHGLQQEYCSSLQLRECLISPSLIQQYPLVDLPDTELFDIQDVAVSILLRKPSILSQSKRCIGYLPTQSLPLEPYHLISPSSVYQLFNSSKADQPVPTPLLQKTQEHYNLPSESPLVYKTLRECLDSMSIFAGRNPLVSQL